MVSKAFVKTNLHKLKLLVIKEHSPKKFTIAVSLRRHRKLTVNRGCMQINHNLPQ